jgi:YbgC/YbaW family acyl-CoA thioester hydrolase
MRVSEHRIRRRVQFYEVDSAGFVHFSWFFRYMEEAEHALWRLAGLRIAPTPDMAFPRRATSFDYRAPIRFEDEVDVLIRITKIERSSIEYSCVLTVDDRVAATGTMTIVCVRTTPSNALLRMPLPDDIVERLDTVPVPSSH